MSERALVEKVRSLIRSEQLLDESKRYIVALSGGPDSVALLLVLRELGYRVEAAHCNFHLRGEESDRDERFCQQLCAEKQVPQHLAHFDTRTYAQLHRVSIEMAARELRYHYFEQLRRDLNAEGICVAHHRDDSVETFLINLVRGTGIHGLSGISPRNGKVLRPMLEVSRKEVLQYLEAEGQAYVTDSTNLIDDVQRNIVRLDVLPLLERLNPAVRANVAATAHRLRDAASLLDALLGMRCRWQKGTDGISLFPIDDISHEYIVWYLLHDYGFTPAQIENIFATVSAREDSVHGRATGQLWQSAHYEAAIDRSWLCLARRVAPVAPLVLPEPGLYVWNDDVKIKEEVVKGASVTKSPTVASLDAGAVRFPLAVRRCAEADRFVPFGMTGSKLVSDFLTDQKQSILQKRRQLVVTDASGRIVWLPGLRTDNRFRVSALTVAVLRITLPA